MNYSIDYTIENVTVVSAFYNFEKFISKIEIICKIDFKEKNKIVKFPITTVLAVPQNNKNYIPFEKVSKKNLIEWSLRDNKDKIDMILNNYLRFKNTNKKSKEQDFVVKTFTENDFK